MMSQRRAKTGPGHCRAPGAWTGSGSGGSDEPLALSPLTYRLVGLSPASSAAAHFTYTYQAEGRGNGNAQRLRVQAR